MGSIMQAKDSLTSQADSMDALLRTREAATLLAVHPRTLRRLVLLGALDQVKIGPRAIRYRRSDIRHIQQFGVTV